MRVVTEVDAGEIRLPGELDFVEPARLGEHRPGEIDVAQELSAGEIADTIEFGSAKVGLPRELRAAEADLVLEFRILEVRVLENLAIKISEWGKSSGLTHAH